MKINKKVGINISLVIGTIIIWSFIISRIVEYYSPSQENKPEIITTNEISVITVNKNDSTEWSEQSWTQIERDPFQKNGFISRKVVPAANISAANMNKGKERNAQSIIPIKTKEEKANSLLLTGIITNNDSKLAIIIDNVTNKTLFLHCGEAYNGILIKEIRDNSVVINEGSFSKELFVKR